MEDHFLLPQSKFEELKINLQEIKDLLNDLKNKPTPLHDWISENEARKLLDLKETSLWGLRKKRMVTFSKIGAKVFYSKKSIEELIRRNSI